MPFAAGDTLTADALNAWQPRSVVKSVSESRTSNIVPAADADLVFTVPAGTSWDLHYVVFLSGDPAGDWSGNLSWTNTATVTYSLVAPGIGTTVNNAAVDMAVGPTTRLDTTSPGLTIECGTITAGSMELIRARVVAGAGADVVVSLNWAQRVSNVTATQILAGSYITPIPVS